jgi:hypothetical protein
MKTSPSSDQKIGSPGGQLAPGASSIAPTWNDAISIAVSGKIEKGTSWGAIASISIEMILIAGIWIGASQRGQI